MITLGPSFFKKNSNDYFIEIHSSNSIILSLIMDYLEGNFDMILYHECIDVNLGKNYGPEEKRLIKYLKSFCVRFNLQFQEKNDFDTT